MAPFLAPKLHEQITRETLFLAMAFSVNKMKLQYPLQYVYRGADKSLARPD